MARIRVLESGHNDALHGALADAALPSLLLRRLPDHWDEAVRIVTPPPTVGFTRRDLRAPGITTAIQVARDHGFHAVVRAPGGRVAAYGPGSVVVDHLVRTGGTLDTVGPFRHNAEAHLHLLRSRGLDARIGELPGEYCPGEFSINLGGRYKVIGSAQRVTRETSLFSTVFQVEATPELHRVLADVSAALDYPFSPATVGGISDATDIDVATFRSILTDDYDRRLTLTPEPLPPALLGKLADLPPEAPGAFDAEDWARGR